MLKFLELKKANMVFNASGALKPLRNANLPLNVILVIEMIQNSLDSSNSDQVNIKFVLHKIGTNNLVNFIRRNLDGNAAITELLSLIQKRSVTDILEMSDTGTKGLTGDIRTKQNCYGINGLIRNNFFNLIFDITRSQTAEFSGGSYGLGKTVYFLCSEIGMVLYYSRCLNDSDEYEHRLVISLISPHIENTISPPSTGIIWWGKNVIETSDGSHLLALTNNEAISFLVDNSLTPFNETETGTKLFVIGPDKAIFAEDNCDIILELYKNAYQWYWPRIVNNGSNSLSKLKIPLVENSDADYCLLELNRIRAKFKVEYVSLSSNTWYLWDENTEKFKLLEREVRDGDIIVASIKNKAHGSIRAEYVTGFISVFFNEVSGSLVNKVHFVRRPGMVLFTESPTFVFGRHCRDYVGLFEVNSELHIEHDIYKNMDDLFKACEDPNHHSWNYRSQERFVNQIVGSSLRVLRDELFKFSIPDNILTTEYQIDVNLSQQLGKYLSFMDRIGGHGNSPTNRREATRSQNNNSTNLEIMDFSLHEDVLSANLRIVWPTVETQIKFGIIENKGATPIGKDEWEEKFKNSICPEYPIEFKNVEILNKMPNDQIEINGFVMKLITRDTIGRGFIEIRLDYILKSANYLFGFKMLK
jgi:hypothetical protein